MITLITGLPGHCKTSYALWKYVEFAEKEKRPVYFNNINLTGEGPPGKWIAHEVEDWESLPAGAIFIIDEAQFKLKVTGKGQRPEWLEKLSVHRHSGVDFVLITQHPSFMDPFVRRLVNEHYHVKRPFGGRKVSVRHFHDGCKDNCEKPGALKEAIVSSWWMKKEVWTWYKSAEAHTGKFKLPLRVVGLMCLPFVIGFLGFTVWQGLHKAGGNSKSVNSAGFGASPGGGGVVSGGAGAGGKTVLTAEEYVAQYQPRVPGLAHTAPAYDDVTRPAVAPYPSACMLMRGECRCYSQQATRLDVPESLCKSVVERGFFVAWQQPQSVQPVAPPAAGGGQALGGGGQLVAAGGGGGAVVMGRGDFPSRSVDSAPVVIDDGPPLPHRPFKVSK